MNISMTMKILDEYGKCKKCGDDTIGNGSKLSIDDSTFERTCRECGWRVSGHITEDGKIMEDNDNI